MAVIRFEVGGGGWARYTERSKSLSAEVMVRFVVDPLDGRAQAVQAVVSRGDNGAEVALGETMRRVRWGKIEAFANQPDSLRLLQERIDEDIEIMLVATGDEDRENTPETAAKVAEGAFHEALKRAKTFADSAVASAAAPWETASLGPRRSPKLRVPDGGKYPDSFYKDFAEVHSSLAAEGASPAAIISDANGVARTTVHRWAKEARRRGLLGPGRRGQTG